MSPSWNSLVLALVSHNKAETEHHNKAKTIFVSLLKENV